MFAGSRPVSAALLILLGQTALSAQPATHPVNTPSLRSPAKWLVDAARDYAQGFEGRPTTHDVEIVLTLMRAAAKLDPQFAEPYQWMEDIYQSLGKAEDSLTALEHYVQRDPANLVARLEWLAQAVGRLQTIEARQRFIQKQLDQAAGQAPFAADAHRRLAEIALTQGDHQTADRQIRAALKLAPHDPTTQRLAYEILARPDDHAAEVRMLLRRIAASPMDIDLIQRLANTLDDLSLHKQAWPWYTYALDVLRAANPTREPPVRLLFELARSRADGGDLEAALQDCTNAVRVDPEYVRVRLLMVHVLRKLKRNDTAETQIRALRDRYAKLADRVVKSKDARLATEMAWFYALYDRRPDEAWRFAQIAITGAAAPEDALRTYGFAALAKADLEKAEHAFLRLAETDQMAAVGLARVYLAGKRSKLAGTVLERAAKLRATGIPHDEIAQMLRANNLPVPQPPDHPNVRKALAEFNAAPLEYYKNPSKFLRLTVAFLNQRLAPGDPWFVQFELTNVGAFSITFGEGMMAIPELLLSATTSGDRDREFSHYLFVDLYRTPVLEPGQSVRVVQTVDIGPLRQVMFMTPQADQGIVLSGILDPAQSANGQWAPRLGGLTTTPARTNKPRLVVSEQLMADLHAGLNSDNNDAVLPAANALFALLAEQEAVRAGRLTYKPAPVNAETVVDALLGAATKPGRDPVLRARLIESFHQIELTNPIVRRLAEGLSDKHWLVRLMTVWLFAHKQGPTFNPVGGRLAKDDPDPLIRDIAAAYLAKWKRPPPPRR